MCFCGDPDIVQDMRKHRRHTNGKYIKRNISRGVSGFLKILSVMHQGVTTGIQKQANTFETGANLVITTL